MTYTEDYIRTKLATDKKWTERALIRLYERQTDSEKATSQTRNHNLRGFAPCDAYMFSQFAKWILRGKTLTDKQFRYCLRPWRGAPSICKYAKQILVVMAEDAENKKKAAAFEDRIRVTYEVVPDENAAWAAQKNRHAELEKEQERAAFMARV